MKYVIENIYSKFHHHSVVSEEEIRPMRTIKNKADTHITGQHARYIAMTYLVQTFVLLCL